MKVTFLQSTYRTIYQIFYTTIRFLYTS